MAVFRQKRMYLAKMVVSNYGKLVDFAQNGSVSANMVVFARNGCIWA